MNGQPNSRIVGASVIGFALVAGAYVLGNFGETYIATGNPAVVKNQIATVRTPIVVVDSDDNGIEDWRDEFVTTEPIVLDEAASASTYTPPETLTGQLGINFMQNILYARGYGDLGRSEEEVIDDTIDVLTTETAHALYDTPDITIIRNSTEADIRTYANAVALAISNNNIPELEGEIYILSDILNRNETDRMHELRSLAEVYRQVRDETLALPVPAILAKQHLDLINAYHAIYKDIDAMTRSLEDPAYTLLRLKRYEDDALGLAYALQNAYRAVEPYARLFSPEDPALLFVLFSPANFKIE